MNVKLNIIWYKVCEEYKILLNVEVVNFFGGYSMVYGCT